MSEPVRVLLVSGSTRAGSGNTAALVTAAAVAPRRVTTVVYDGLDRLPAFNPDDDGDRVPREVAGLRFPRRPLATAPVQPQGPWPDALDPEHLVRRPRIGVEDRVHGALVGRLDG